MRKRSDYTRIPRADGSFVSATDTANQVDRKATNSKTGERQITSPEKRYSMADWISYCCWLPLWQSNEFNTH